MFAQVETLNWAMTAIERVGMSVVLLALIAFGIWRLAKWSGPLISGLVESHRKLVDTLADTANSQEAITKRQGEILEQQSALLTTIHALTESPVSGEMRRHWDERFDRIEDRLKP